MGNIKVDLHKGQRQFEQLTLSDQDVVKWLILYRDKVDIYFGSKTDNFYDNAGNVKELNQELISLYIDLEILIQKCELSEEQRELIFLLSTGFTFRDIEDIKDIPYNNVRRRFNNICKLISKENDKLWSIWVHGEYIKSQWKTCSKCNESLPATNNFFSPHKKGKYGLRNICKSCR